MSISKATVDEEKMVRGYEILALDVSDGQQIWSFNLGERSHFHAPLAIYQNNVLAGSANGDVYAINCDTGANEQIYHMNKAVYCQPYCSVTDQIIYIVDRNTHITELKVECHIIVMKELRRILSTHFNESELKDVCHDLGIKYGEIAVGATTINDISRKLIQFLDRRNKLDELIKLVKQLRPHIKIGGLLGECNEY